MNFFHFLYAHTTARAFRFARLALMVVSLWLAGCAGNVPAKNLDLFAAVAPLPTLVPRGREMAAAEADAARRPGDFALNGVGPSMQPAYVTGTAIVVHPCSVRALRRGMAVVYLNDGGNYVAHMVLEELPRGWLAIGLNNAEPDDELVNDGNIVGVIREAYAADDAEFRPDVAERIALKQALVHGRTVTLAH